MEKGPILLVDDDPYLRRACEISLRQRGHLVFTAADGQEALQKAAETKPCLILLDLLMPKMSGVDVLRVLKEGEDTREVPVVILSNSSGERHLATAREMGVVDIIVKANISLEELSDRVDTILRKLYPGRPGGVPQTL